MPVADTPPEPPPAQVFDLAQLSVADQAADFRAVRPRCPVGRPGEIVVCAPDPEKERLRALPQDYAVTEGLPRAELGIAGGVSLDVHLDSATLAGGQTANRVMVGAKIKF